MGWGECVKVRQGGNEGGGVGVQGGWEAVGRLWPLSPIVMK